MTASSDDFVALETWASQDEVLFNAVLERLENQTIKAHFEVLQPSDQWLRTGVRPAWFPAAAIPESRRPAWYPAKVIDEWPDFNPDDWDEPFLEDGVIARVERLNRQSRWAHLKRPDGKVLVLEAWIEPPHDLIHLGTGRLLWLRRDEILIPKADAQAVEAEQAQRATETQRATEEGQRTAEVQRATEEAQRASEAQRAAKEAPAASRAWKAAMALFAKEGAARYLRADGSMQVAKVARALVDHSISNRFSEGYLKMCLGQANRTRGKPDLRRPEGGAQPQEEHHDVLN